MIRSLAPVVLLSMISATAESQTMLKVHLSDNSPITVSVDGRYYNRRGTSITVGDLPPGTHFLRIFALRLDRWGRGHEEAIFQGRVKTHEGMATLFSYDYENDVTNMEERDMA